eukprot:m.267907 g.267907  ORF g.267907 m.267907 type:complete len:169 (-) comp75312_c0_seq1:45-551(-)
MATKIVQRNFTNELFVLPPTSAPSTQPITPHDGMEVLLVLGGLAGAALVITCLYYTTWWCLNCLPFWLYRPPRQDRYAAIRHQETYPDDPAYEMMQHRQLQLGDSKNLHSPLQRNDTPTRNHDPNHTNSNAMTTNLSHQFPATSRQNEFQQPRFESSENTPTKKSLIY